MVRIGGGEAIPRSVPREDFTPGVSRFQASVNNADHQTELDQYISFMFYITARLLHGLLEKIGINTVLDKSEYSLLCVFIVCFTCIAHHFGEFKTFFPKGCFNTMLWDQKTSGSDLVCGFTSQTFCK